MAIITAPVEGLTEKIVGVAFVDSVAQTDDEGAIAYFERAGYTVDHDPKPGEGEKPLEERTNEQIKAYADEHGIDLAGASKKDDMLAVIKAAEAEKGGDQS